MNTHYICGNRLLKLKTENTIIKLIFKCIKGVVGPIFNIFKFMNSAWTVHALFINSEFCLWKSIIVVRERERERAFENAAVDPNTYPVDTI